MTNKLKLNAEELSGCGGCQLNLVDMHEKLLQILDSVEIQRCQLLTDEKGCPPADIGILAGAIRNEHDRAAALKMRAACKTLIAFGTCAVFGGIPGAALAHSREEILEQVYVRSRTTVQGKRPGLQVSQLEKLVTPVDEVIDVEYYLPGCPPHAAFTFDALLSLVENRGRKMTGESVCGRCRRTMRPSETSVIKANHQGLPDSETCFLSQGYLCLGSVTVDRCLSPCPGIGVPCTGCAGPTMQICTEPNRDIRTEVAQRMSRLTKIPYESIMAEMERSAKTHYAYAMATKMIGGKPTFLINKWIDEVEKAV